MAELDQVVVRQYSDNCYTMAQQKGSRLSNCCTRIKMTGEKTALERVGVTEAEEATGKYGNSPIIETPFDRRWMHAKPYHWGDMVDWKDKLEVLIDPTSIITKAGAYAIGRRIDRVIIEQGIFGAAYGGKDGLTQIEFPDSQKVSITAGATGATNASLNIEKLIQARSLICNADIDVDDPNEKLYFVYTQKQLDELLRSVDVANKEYSMIYDLYMGRTNTFMGFEFVRLSKDIVPTVELDGGVARQCFAFAKSIVQYGEPLPVEGRIAERADKQFNWYSYMKFKGGAGRMQDEGVVHIPCFEAV